MKTMFWILYGITAGYMAFIGGAQIYAAWMYFGADQFIMHTIILFTLSAGCATSAYYTFKAE